MDKRGQVGLDTAKTVMLALLVMAVIGFAIMLAFANLTSTDVSATTGTGSVTNETLVGVNQTAYSLSVSDFVGCSATVSNVDANGTLSIDSANYTVSGCSIRVSDTGGFYNVTQWGVNYTYTYNQFSSVSRNITGGVDNFFSNATTWFSLMAVVVIILIISIVIIAVNRFGRGRETGL